MNIDIEREIRRAFENEKYDWRTVRGIAKESGTSHEEVRLYISHHGEELVKSSALNSEGEQLYTTRSHYKQRVGLGSRITSILRNRGA